MAVQDYAKAKLSNLINKKKIKIFILTKVLPFVVAIALVVVLVATIVSAISGGGSESGVSNGAYFSASGNSVFYDNSFTKEEFIKAAQEYNVPHETYGDTGRYKDEYYKKAFAEMAGEYFDISVSYGFDPRATFCTGIQESAYGTSNIAVDKCNYWGIGAIDSDPYNQAKTYNSIPEGIKDLCELWKEYTTEGTWHYNTILERGGDPNTIEGIGSLYSTDGTWASQKINLMKNIFGYTPSGIIDTSSFLSTAKSVWQQVCNRFDKYGASNIVPTGTIIDCSSYVSWVLYEYGYTGFEGPQTCTVDFYNTNWNEKYGWTEIPVGATENVIEKVQPGDLLVRYNGTVHHITLIVEVKDGTVYVYDCGSSDNWIGKNGEPAINTSFITASKESKQAPGKIIRVTKPE